MKLSYPWLAIAVERYCFATLPFIAIWTLLQCKGSPEAGEFALIFTGSVLFGGILNSLVFTHFPHVYSELPATERESHVKQISGSVLILLTVLCLVAKFTTDLLDERYGLVIFLAGSGTASEFVFTFLRTMGQSRNILRASAVQCLGFLSVLIYLYLMDLLTAVSLILVIASLRLVIFGWYLLGLKEALKPSFKFDERLLTQLQRGKYSCLEFASNYVVLEYPTLWLWLYGELALIGQLAAIQSLIRPVRLLVLSDQMALVSDWVQRQAVNGNLPNTQGMLLSRMKTLGTMFVIIWVFIELVLGQALGFKLPLEVPDRFLLLVTTGLISLNTYLRSQSWLERNARTPFLIAMLTFALLLIISLVFGDRLSLPTDILFVQTLTVLLGTLFLFRKVLLHRVGTRDDRFSMSVE